MVECRHRFPLASIAVDAQFGRDVREVAALFLQRCADRQSRRTAHQITMRFHERAGRAIINFATTMPPADSDLAQQATRNPYLAAPRVYAVGRGTMLRMDPATLDNISKLGPIATALAAVVALIVGIVAVTQKSRADRRDQWWKRAQWAIEQTFTDNEEQQALGFRVLQVLASSDLAMPEELRVLESLTTREIEPLAPEGHEGDDG